ncbi:MAG TPA: helix-turn-helix transcriptional regulator [Longimicrobiaceae bacterium]|nr:helix-turn-helix transcriptional regulator [Longimicrobiaceae bacterium]
MESKGKPRVTNMYFSPAIRESPDIRLNLWRAVDSTQPRLEDESAEFPVIFVAASDILGGEVWRPPLSAMTSESRYVIIADVPIPALARLSSVFDLRRPDQRMHVTKDHLAIKRLLIARCRVNPMEGIGDAYLLGKSLTLLLGDVTIRSFPVSKIPVLHGMNWDDISNFEIDEDGSFLLWPEADLHLGVSQLLQAVDPSYLADIEVRRFPASAAIGEMVSEIRDLKGLRQRDIDGMSERHVRRIEQGVARLTGDTAARLARAFDIELHEFLAQVSQAATASRTPAESR